LTEEKQWKSAAGEEPGRNNCERPETRENMDLIGDLLGVPLKLTIERDVSEKDWDNRIGCEGRHASRCVIRGQWHPVCRWDKTYLEELCLKDGSAAQVKSESPNELIVHFQHPGFRTLPVEVLLN
jgi:hypothetical protein